MPSKTKAQLQQENAALVARLNKLQANRVGALDNGGAHPDDGLPPAGFPKGRPSTDTLEASEKRYRRLFETARDGILILDADTGKITDVNPFMGELLGYAREELLDKALWDIGPFKDIVASKAAFRQLQSREYIRYENLPLETKDGVHKQVEFVSNVYRVDGRRVIQCNVRDITARRLAEDDLRQVNDELIALVAELKRNDEELQCLSQMNDLLQACTTQAEAYQVVGLLAGDLFPGQGGFLAVLRAWDHYLEVVAHWGTAAINEPVFALDDCWAMRRGRLHVVVDPAAGLLCRHFVSPATTGYLCVPLAVQGDTLGVLCLWGHAQGEVNAARQQQLAVTVGEAIKLSLSNLRLREKLREQAVRDPLTGLFNRRYLEDGLGRELHRAQRNGNPLCVVMLDLDHFKQFNDAHGHNAGDALLRALAQLLRDHLRDSDILCRYGGEEFLLVFPDSSLADTAERMEQIRKLVTTLQIKHGEHVLGSVTVSAGVASALEHGFDSAALLIAVDEAVYAAKHAGRNRIVVDRGPQPAAT